MNIKIILYLIGVINYHFFNELKKIHDWHNFLIKSLLKRAIYKKIGLDDYEIHIDVLHYFELFKTSVELLLFSSFSSYLCYYNGNIENYEKNIMTYFNILNDLIYTEYYLNEEKKERMRKKKERMRKKKEKMRKKKEKERKKKEKERKKKEKHKKN